MHVYRITLEKYSKKLVASGRAARWNSRGNYLVYTAASRALACLENVVHRSGEGLNNYFKVISIEIPDDLHDKKILLSRLQKDWLNFSNYSYTQGIGDKWIARQKSALLQVPSAIIPNEFNYLLNPNHADFKKIKVKKIDDFIFDPRLAEN